MKKRWLTGLFAVVLILSLGLAACPTSVEEKIVYVDREPSTIDELAVLKAGTYTAESGGWHGPVKVTAEFAEHYIINVTVESTESSRIGVPASRQVAQQIVELQSTNVDVVSGATFSSLAVMAAVRDCIVQAGGTEKMLSYDARTIPVTIRGKPEDFNPDVIVVGGGLGGVYAAMRVADLGGKALLIEQAPHLGGSTRFAAGAYTGAELPGQSPNLTQATIPNYTAWLKSVNQGVDGFNEAASAAYVKFIKPATQKLADWGMVITYSDSYGADGGLEGTEDASGHPTAAMFMRNGQALFADIEARMNSFINAGYMGYILNSKVVDIVMDGANVAGVKIEDGREYRAGAVIMATGGYSCNPNILSIPEAQGGPGITYWTISSSQTDIGNMTEVLMKPPYNAKTYRLDQVRFDGGVLPMVQAGAPYRLKIPVPYGHGNTDNAYKRIFLNKNGERFTNESLGADAGGTHSPTDFLRWDEYRKAPDQLVWVLGSGAKPRLSDGELGPSEPNTVNANGNRAWWQTQVDAGNYIWESDDSQSVEAQIKDLATRAGLNADTVWSTVNEYNGYCDAGADPDWNRPADGLQKMDAGPFWVVKTSGHIKGTLGGLDLTAKAEVPNASGPIPGLYAAGEIGGNVAYTGTIWLVGFNLSAEASFGEIAANEALAWSRAH